MMDYVPILAQVTETAVNTKTKVQIVPVDFIYEQIIALSWFQAVIAISFGVVCLLYGWRIFKVLVVISFALLGLTAGLWLGRQFGSELLGGIFGLSLLAILSVPLMRWAVSILGAIAGGILTAGLWYACELPEQYIWAGALTGIVAGCMISFVVFKIAVMLFSSVAGSAIMVTGLLALLHHYGPTMRYVNDLSHHHNWFLPAALLIPTVTGIILQNKFVKGSKDWCV